MEIKIRELTAGYGDNHVLTGLNSDIESGRITTLIGPNGCGKSTLLKSLGRLLRPQSGGVYLDGKAIHKMNTSELAKKMAILPQMHEAPDDLNVESLVSYGRFPHRQRFSPLSRNDYEIIENVLALTRLESLRYRQVSTLSGGERQRAWIAMTLAQEPELLLLDEPTTFLDVCCQFEIIELIRNLNRKFGMTIIMVLHDINMAVRCSDNLMAIKDKQIFCHGAPEKIITQELLREVFNIDSEIIIDKEGRPYFIPVASCRRISE